MVKKLIRPLEIISDLILLILVVIPIFLFFLTAQFCQGGHDS